MTLRLPTAQQNAHASATTNAVDAGAGAGTVKVYTGAQPATANDPTSGTLLITWTLNDPAYAAPAAGVAALDVTPAITAVAGNSGTAGWFRVADSTGATVFDGAVGSQMTFDNAVIASGQTCNLTAGSVTQPAQ